jgi:hypothetical protein
MKVQTHVSSEDGEIFDISFNSGNVSFIIIDMEIPEINQMLEDIKTQVYMLKQTYDDEKKSLHSKDTEGAK